ncbi:hypothetical protein KXV73_002146, partial [Aspergillus fumigatus]
KTANELPKTAASDAVFGRQLASLPTTHTDPCVHAPASCAVGLTHPQRLGPQVAIPNP